MLKALVTGAGGFIGTHLVNELLRIGTDVTALTLRAGRTEANGRVKTIKADIRDKNSLRAIPSDIEAVFHLAASVHKIPRTAIEEIDAFEVNSIGTKNLLDSLGPTVRHMVFFSTVAVYGLDSGEMIDETTPTRPLTPYARSKLTAENLAAEWGLRRGVGVTTLRLPLVYGPGNKGNIYRLIEAIDRGRFLMPGRGLNKKSMVYVGNVVEAAIRAVKKASGGVYIVTDYRDYEMKEIYRLLSEHLGREPRSFYIPEGVARMLAKVGDRFELFPLNSETLGKLSMTLTFSSLRMRKDLDFTPELDFYLTAGNVVDWYKEVNRSG